jgi:hypothetical protein
MYNPRHRGATPVKKTNNKIKHCTKGMVEEVMFMLSDAYPKIMLEAFSIMDCP